MILIIDSDFTIVKHVIDSHFKDTHQYTYNQNLSYKITTQKTISNYNLYNFDKIKPMHSKYTFTNVDFNTNIYKTLNQEQKYY